MQVEDLLMTKGQRFAVTAWSAWAPGRETPEDWRAWVGVAQSAIALGPVAVPMMLRRRTTDLGQRIIAAALACAEAAHAGRYVLASRHGEFSRTLRILRSLAARELPSPADFGMSVHNALAGLLSIHFGNMRGHTAIAAGLDTFGFGLMEAAACLAEQPQDPVLLIFGDEPLSGEFVTFGADDIELPLVVAVALRSPGAGDEGILFDAAPRSVFAWPSGVAGRPCATLPMRRCASSPAVLRSSRR
jgi:hypothetical protein